jgi:hypothetical protein
MSMICFANKPDILKHSTHRARHWETKGNNHPYHNRGRQDNHNNHTMVGNMTRIIQVPEYSNLLLNHYSLTILRNNNPLSISSRFRGKCHNYPNSTSNQSRIWEPHLAMGKVWNINTLTHLSLLNPFNNCARHVYNNCVRIACVVNNGASSQLFPVSYNARARSSLPLLCPHHLSANRPLHGTRVHHNRRHEHKCHL